MAKLIDINGLKTFKSNILVSNDGSIKVINNDNSPIDIKTNISSEEGNNLQLKEDGLYVSGSNSSSDNNGCLKQVTELPEDANIGDIYQYIGETNNEYVNGGIYKCTEKTVTNNVIAKCFRGFSFKMYVIDNLFYGIKEEEEEEEEENNDNNKFVPLADFLKEEFGSDEIANYYINIIEQGFINENVSFVVSYEGSPIPFARTPEFDIIKDQEEVTKKHWECLSNSVIESNELPYRPENKIYNIDSVLLYDEFEYHYILGGDGGKQLDFLNNVEFAVNNGYFIIEIENLRENNNTERYVIENTAFSNEDEVYEFLYTVSKDSSFVIMLARHYAWGEGSCDFGVFRPEDYIEDTDDIDYTEYYNNTFLDFKVKIYYVDDIKTYSKDVSIITENNLISSFNYNYLFEGNLFNYSNIISDTNITVNSSPAVGFDANRNSNDIEVNFLNDLYAYKDLARNIFLDIRYTNDIDYLIDFNWNAFTKLTNLTVQDNINKFIDKYGISPVYLNGSNTIVNVETNCKLIGDNSFANCSKLESVYLCYIRKIGYSAFENCTSLWYINISNIYRCGDVIIERDAFKNCSSLEIVELSKDIVRIEEGAFDGIPENGTLYCNSDWFENLDESSKNNLGNLLNWERREAYE